MVRVCVKNAAFAFILLISFISSTESFAHKKCRGPDCPGFWGAFEFGYTNSITPGNVTVQPMPNVDSPDNYIPTQQTSDWTVGVGVGYKFVGDMAFCLPANRIGIYYDYYFETTVRGDIDKYQTIKAYDYSYKVTSNTAWLHDQLELIEYENFTLFIEGGIGAAFNYAFGYDETPVPANPDVRFYSADFKSHTDVNFAYRLGAGISYSLTNNIDLGIFYRYSDLGNASTGGSKNYPSMEDGLKTSFRTSQYMATLRYNA